MLKRLTDFPDVITLIPNSGIQMLDFGFDIKAVKNISRPFYVEHQDQPSDTKNRQSVHLHPVRDLDDDKFVYYTNDAPEGKLAPAHEVSSYRSDRAIGLFDGEWLPAPVLRSKTAVAATANGLKSGYDTGPTGWARVRVVALETPDEDGNTHRVTLAVDSTLGPARREAAPHLSPEPRDATDPVDFSFVSDPFQIMFFLEAAAIRRWLKDAFLSCCSKKRGREVTEDDVEPGEYWAQYVMLIEAINTACSVPRIKLIDTVSSPKTLQTIDVDLVIDVGNSRTCGILIEKEPGAERLDISQATRLELRDLTRPELAYSDPFETWVEFSPARFGSYAHARRASHQNAFWWPSLVRIGPEASWLAAKSDGTEGITGLSSPKRYLWDKAPRPQPWSNTRGLTPPGEDPSEIKGPMTAELTESGDVLGSSHLTVGTSPRYSRRSLYTLMLVELLSHAAVQINSPALRSQRANRDIPRRLNNLILTLPSATPLAEQRSLRDRATEAWQLLARIMSWDSDDPLHREPKIRMDWDEASCTHLVFLHNEINCKYQGQPRDLFGILGQGRKGSGGGPAVRIASIDIGGGTTDLTIIEHEVEGQRIVHPNQLFREGFRLAGDDVVKTIIEQMVLPSLVKHLSGSGVSNANELITDLFGGDREGMAQQDRTLRRNYVNQVFAPAAQGLMAAYEDVNDRRNARPETCQLGDLLPIGREPQPHVLAYLEREATRRGATDFSICDVHLTMDQNKMAGAISSVIGTMVDDLCDIVRHFGCDLLLLSGRPSRLPVVRDRVNSNLPLEPHRVVPMHTYEIQNWYPFRSSDFRISDPKTTAAVGAMLCLMCEGQTDGFFMKSSEIRMTTTARYLGIMNQRGEITEDSVLAKNFDSDPDDDQMVEFIVSMEGPTFIGFRQLPLARWKTTPLYYLYFRDVERISRLKLPINVTMQRKSISNNSGDDSGLEQFILTAAEDSNGRSCKNDIAIRFQTLRIETQGDAGYWLDTGILRTPVR